METDQTGRMLGLIYVFAGHMDHFVAFVLLQLFLFYTVPVSICRFFSLAAVYFVGGFLYKRFAMGAKGLEQIPNYRFWEDFGNLQAVSKHFCHASLTLT